MCPLTIAGKEVSSICFELMGQEHFDSADTAQSMRHIVSTNTVEKMNNNKLQQNNILESLAILNHLFY